MGTCGHRETELNTWALPSNGDHLSWSAALLHPERPRLTHPPPPTTPHASEGRTKTRESFGRLSSDSPATAPGLPIRCGLWVRRRGVLISDLLTQRIAGLSGFPSVAAGNETAAEARVEGMRQKCRKRPCLLKSRESHPTQAGQINNDTARHCFQLTCSATWCLGFVISPQLYPVADNGPSEQDYQAVTFLSSGSSWK